MLIKETVKIIRASTPSNMVEVAYWVIRYPVSKATNKNNIKKRVDRTLYLGFGTKKSFRAENQAGIERCKSCQ